MRAPEIGVLVYNMFLGVKRGVQPLTGYVSKARSIIAEEILKWIAWIMRKLEQMKKFVLSLPGKALALIKNIYPKVKYVVTQAAYAIQLFVALLWAITVWGFVSLSRLLAAYSLGLVKK